MQLMHIEYCLYCASWAGDCRYSPSDVSFTSSRMMYGLTSCSLSMKPSMSTTRSRSTAKFTSGSTLIGNG